MRSKKTRPRASAPEASLVAPAGWGASPRQVQNIVAAYSAGLAVKEPMMSLWCFFSITS